MNSSFDQLFLEKPMITRYSRHYHPKFDSWRLAARIAIVAELVVSAAEWLSTVRPVTALRHHCRS